MYVCNVKTNMSVLPENRGGIDTRSKLLLTRGLCARGSSLWVGEGRAIEQKRRREALFEFRNFISCSFSRNGPLPGSGTDSPTARKITTRNENILAKQRTRPM